MAKYEQVIQTVNILFCLSLYFLFLSSFSGSLYFLSYLHSLCLFIFLFSYLNSACLFISLPPCFSISSLLYLYSLCLSIVLLPYLYFLSHDLPFFLATLQRLVLFSLSLSLSISILYFHLSLFLSSPTLYLSYAPLFHASPFLYRSVLSVFMTAYLPACLSESLLSLLKSLHRGGKIKILKTKDELLMKQGNTYSDKTSLS